MMEVKNLSRDELEKMLRVTLFNNFGYSKDEIDEECEGDKYSLICKLFNARQNV